MWDSRVDKLARIIVGYSLDVKRGDRVLLWGPETAEDLLLAVYRETLRAGGNPLLWPALTRAVSLFLEHAEPEQLTYLSPSFLHAIENADAVLNIDAPANTKALVGVDPKRQIAYQRARRPVVEAMLRIRWVKTQFPTEALAQETEMSLAAYENFFFEAVLQDWPAIQAQMNAWKAILEAGREIRVVGPATDLTLQVGGRTWQIAAGEKNLPDGEIYTGPIEDSASGRITFDFPAVRFGREVDGVRLEFERGRVIQASAARGESYLLQTLEADDGATLVGEIGIGLNYGITQFTKSILFDEKIGGTIHVAIGASPPGTGGVNQSSIHWDMVKDLRQSGEVYLDGKLIQKNGKFLI